MSYLNKEGLQYVLQKIKEKIDSIRSPKPNWNSPEDSESGILGRTHYADHYVNRTIFIEPITYDNKTLFEFYGTTKTAYRIYIQMTSRTITLNSSHTSETVYVNGREATFKWEYLGNRVNLLLTTHTSRITFSIDIEAIDVAKKLHSGYIDYDIARTYQLAELEEKVEKISPAPMLSVTYDELVSLRDNGELIAGMQYRITDYVTTTAQEDTSSAGHQFDVIVTADNENTLNEVARACLHDGDSYFSEAGAKLEAWQIWYSLDNDTDRFSWADNRVRLDSTGCSIKSDLVDGNAFKTPMPFSYFMWNDPSDGEIYNSVKLDSDLIYEFGFETEPNGNDSLFLVKSDVGMYEDEGVDYGDKFYYRGTVVVDDVEYDCWQKTEHGSYVTEVSPKTIYALTEKIVEGEIESLGCQGKGVIYRMIDEWNNDLPYDFKNIMYKRYKLDAPSKYIADKNEKKWVEQLSANVIKMFTNDEQSYIWSGVSNQRKTWGGDVYSSLTGETAFFYTFSSNNEDASLQSSCHDNSMSFGNVLPNNVFFGAGCYSNSFGSGCTSNSFGSGCYYNSFGDSCTYNSFGNSCTSNSFGNYCTSNSFGNYCTSNSFGNYCTYNSFGSVCSSNSFGNSCDSNSFGNSCYSNSFGDDCTYNSFGNYCKHNTLMIKYKNISFGYAVQHATLRTDDSSSGYSYVQNYRVASGIQGTDDEPIVVEVKRKLDYETTIAKNSAGEIKVFCVADLIE